MSKILVTGGTGFIGSHLVDALIENNHQVSLVDNLSTGRRGNINPKADFFETDIKDFNRIRPLFNGIDFVFHLAANPRIPLSIEKPRETNEVNINGTLNALLASKEAGVKKFIYSSSSSVYGDQEELPVKEGMTCSPLSPYALQKYVGEAYCKIFSEIYGLPTVSLRYFSVYGPRYSKEGEHLQVIALFLEKKKQGEPLTITGDGEQTRDFTSVFDVVRANILAMGSGKVGKGEAINVGGGKDYSIKEVAKLIGGEIKYIPLQPGEVDRNLADISLAKELLNWEPKIKLEEGIKQLLKEL
ncbi:MAG: NAD-dependent epimerase/dehydratase family protein [Patescibacteria group bacterium]|nr:NAD-dependent epimerase/dehydratase family protein [Patescibacteria group bacterium]